VQNHLTDDNVDVFSSDYYKHQVLTAQSFMEPGIAGWITFLFTGGLNLQIEHHLFPCLNHCHLPYIRPIVKAVCKKHGVPYTESSGLVEALGKYFSHLETLSAA
jgi:delta11-fatty-acid desaturase